LHTICILYEVNTQHIQFQSLATRINNLTAAVEAAPVYVDRALTPGGFSPLRAIFLAPEYLFSRAIAAALPSQTSSGFRKIRFGVERRGEQKWGERRQMGEEETVKLRVRFASLSTAFTNALLIPGSVAWRKLIASQQAQVKYQNPDQKPPLTSMRWRPRARFSPVTQRFSRSLLNPSLGTCTRTWTSSITWRLRPTLPRTRRIAALTEPRFSNTTKSHWFTAVAGRTAGLKLS
jgi:hypothetical protein